ncbi:MAG: 3-oxoacyl-[acyl-carrier-protein] synthase 2 [Candidatus Scalindua sp.]|nr:beta-ketoacyl-[acyl-carrier-protein] synthase family protein [Planctomycetota bacterium]GJQ59221.1 MAG: 3-oxoacyl-[acyl-carrier-protein] synthase 2 [Candidatus Scalindua sp.]
MSKVVVTGLGLVLANGIGVKDAWEALIQGKDGSGEVTSFDTSPYKIHRACEVKDFKIDTTFENETPAHTIHKYAYSAAKEALEDSGLHNVAKYDCERFGIAIGTLAGELPPFEYLLRNSPDEKANGFDMNVALTYPPSSITSLLSEDFGFEGPNMVSLNACSSGNHAIAWAYDLLLNGKVDVMLVGGGELIPQTEFTHFHNLKALTPEKCRPFDKERKGLIIGEGAGIMVIENLDFAKKRGANIYAELKSYGMSCDGHHMTAPHPEGAGAIRSMMDALSVAQLSYKDIDYVNAHGTGTPLNDRMETMAIKSVFKERAKQIPVSSIKSMIGHTMGAASAIESVTSCLSIKNNIVPPTINYETPDPECDLDYVPNEGRELRVNCVLNNSFAFGGNNVTNIFSRL